MNRAPIDAATIAKVLAPFGSSTGLPGDAYRNAELFDWETTHFVAGTWFCLGRLDDLLQPGQARAIEVGGETALLVRDGDDTRAFSNVCRHRGHELAPVGAAFDAGFIRCPYHAWTYRPDGSLVTAPTFGDRIDKSQYPLVEINASVWAGWLFVNLDGRAEPLEAYLGNLAPVLYPYGVADLVPAHHHAYTVEANWKLLVENYSECYHCTSIHPALCEVTPVASGADLAPTGLWYGGTMDLKGDAVTMSLDGASPIEPLPGVHAERLRQVVYVSVFPNLLISAHPDYVLTHRLVPLGPDQTAVECAWLFAEDAVAEPGFDPAYAVDFWDLTNREDWAVCEGVQRGMGNSGHRPGPLSTWEATAYQFLTMVGRAYLGQGLTPSPTEERLLTD